MHFKPQISMFYSKSYCKMTLLRREDCLLVPDACMNMALSLNEQAVLFCCWTIHLQMSILAGCISAGDVENVGPADKPGDDEYVTEGEEEYASVLFNKRVTLSFALAGSDTFEVCPSDSCSFHLWVMRYWKSSSLFQMIGQGELQVYFAQDQSCYKVYMETGDGMVVCDHAIQLTDTIAMWVLILQLNHASSKICPSNYPKILRWNSHTCIILSPSLEISFHGFLGVVS